MLHLVIIPQIPWKLEEPDKLCWNHPTSCPGGSFGKESSYNVGDLGSVPGLGRSPGEGNGYPLQYCGLENSVDCIWGHKELDVTELLSLPFTSLHPHAHIVPATEFLAQCFSMKESPTSLFWFSFSFNKKMSPREQAALYLSKVNMLTVSLEWTKIAYKFTAGNIPMVLASHSLM